MIPSMKRFYKYLLIYALALVLIASALTVPILTSDTDFSIYNTGWNGCSNLTERTHKIGRQLPTITVKNTDANTQIIHDSFINYDLKPTKSSILIIGPSLKFSDKEANYIQHFLLEGGKVLLADDFGTGNDLLQKINATTRFSLSLLIDLAYEKKPQYGVVFNFQEHPITTNVSRILLNFATTLFVGDNTTVLANSSAGSWLDRNMNGKMDDWEQKGPLPILAIERYGEGELILLSDPSILINLMYKYLDNSMFNENLLGYLGNDRDVIMIDESHRDTAEAFTSVFFMAAALATLQKIGILILLGVTLFLLVTNIPKQIIIRTRNGITSYLGRLRKKKSTKTADVSIITVMNRHPSWDKNILIKIVREISKQRGGNT
ncbi:MAG: DUF4350 domain-containing protein [Candidatus Hodarchaeota archaeon]